MIANFTKYSLYKTFTIFYILLYIVFLLTTFFTVHSHRLPDGKIVSHSHFSLNNSEGETEKGKASHSHQEIEFIFIVSANNLHVIVVGALHLNSVERDFELRFIDIEERLVYNDLILNSNKSPPSFI